MFLKYSPGFKESLGNRCFLAYTIFISSGLIIRYTFWFWISKLAFRFIWACLTTVTLTRLSFPSMHVLGVQLKPFVEYLRKIPRKTFAFLLRFITNSAPFLIRILPSFVIITKWTLVSWRWSLSTSKHTCVLRYLPFLISAWYLLYKPPPFKATCRPYLNYPVYPSNLLSPCTQKSHAVTHTHTQPVCPLLPPFPAVLQDHTHGMSQVSKLSEHLSEIRDSELPFS